MARFRKIQERSPLLGDVRGRGLMIGLELVRDRETKEPAPAQAKQMRAALRERGILVGLGGIFSNVVRIQPPLSITTDECTRLADEAERVLLELRA
jgi:4-aminobutyrate aminotransferase-like enzyme